MLMAVFGDFQDSKAFNVWVFRDYCGVVNIVCGSFYNSYDWQCVYLAVL